VLTLLRPVLPESDAVNLDGTPLAYAIRTNARRRLALRVLGDGSVRVTVPPRTSLRTVRAFVTQHGVWVRRKQAEMHARPATRIADGARIRLLDETLVLRLGREAGRTHVIRDGGDLWLHGAPATRRAALENWYRRHAVDHAERRLDHFAPVVGRRPLRLSIRGQRTRWGSCSASGTVTLNWRLLQLPAALFDYVLVHELCHLIQRNHAPAFWREVARVLPDWRERRRQLRVMGRELALDVPLAG
jgi:predicted metal-dependent hydrolase